ncbi:MAG: ABC transporter permease [Thermoanaerobaculia bacterium]
MFAYQLRIAWKSLKRSPVLSTLLVLGIALGIGVATAFVTTYYLMARDPLPDKSTELFHVQIDNWRPEVPWDEDRPEEPPDQIAYPDAVNLMASDIPTRQSAMFKASLTVHPEGEGKRPYRAMTRLVFHDFFPMFEVPFAYGGPWDDAADRDAEPVVVLDHETNLKLFGGEDSVGRKIRVEDRDFTVVGVLAPWRPTIKVYDTTQSEFQAPEELFMPFNLVRPMEITTAGNTSGWKGYSGDEFEDFLQSETIWIQMWVELPTAETQAAYRDWLDAYTREQQSHGRLPREVNNRVRNVLDWMAAEEVVPDEATTLLVISLLFMIVCSVNLIGILLGKFLARAPEVGVRRALGASRSSVFVQHIVECELLGLLGGVLGLGLSVVALGLINRLLSDVTAEFSLDWKMVLAGLFLSLVAGLIAGVYPSWRICRVAPANYLKIQ